MVQSWLNSDGLYLKYGPDKATAKIAGEYRKDGRLHEIEVKIDLTDLTETETIVDDTVLIPANVVIQEVEIVTLTAATTGAAIDLGLIQTNRSTEIDYDGLLAAFPTASMNAAGEKTIITDNTTYDGVKIGANPVSTVPGHITCSRTTSTAFDTGVIYVTIRYYKP